MNHLNPAVETIHRDDLTFTHTTWTAGDYRLMLTAEASDPH